MVSTPINTYITIHTIIPLTKSQSSHPLYTEPRLSVTRIPSPKNCFSSPLYLRIMDMAPSRYDDPWNPHHGPWKLRTNPSWLQSYHTHKQHMDDSAECWLNITSKASPYHRGKSTAATRQGLLGTKNTGVKASHVNVAKCTLDRAVDPSTSE